MQLLNPIWLWGLTGLIIPVAIHLLSRREGKVIKIGSIRHLEDTTTKRFKNIRLNEYLLLALRCLIIILLVLFLSGLQFTFPIEKEKWLLIENGLAHETEFAPLVDSLTQNGFEIKSLSPGFPAMNDSLHHQKVQYWSLLDELKTKPVKQAVILAYNYAEGFKGKRLQLPDYIAWIVKSPPQESFVLRAIQVSQDSALLRRGESNAERTNLDFDRIKSNALPLNLHTSDSISVEQPATLSVSIFFDAPFAYDAIILSAALQAIDEISPDRVHIESLPSHRYTPAVKSNWVIFLSKDAPPPVQQHNIQFRSIADPNQPLFRLVKNKDGYLTWILTQRLNEEVALRENLTVQLSSILNTNDTYARRAEKFDRRVLPEQVSWDQNVSQERELNARPQSASTLPYLTMILLTSLVAERWISYRRQQ